jgi:hypothetical protein
VKLIRSLGNSYTVSTGDCDPKKLKRGLQPFDGATVPPDGLGEHFDKHFLIKMRQTISAMDKVVRKKKKLKQINLEVYVDRTLLGQQLWLKLVEFGENIENDAFARSIERYRDIWNSKIHPYTKKECIFSSPAGDANGKKLKELEADSKVSRQDFEGRWHGKFWVTNPKDVAAAIFEHLHEKEVRLAAKGPSRKPNENYGLVEARARSIVTSTNDPREGKAQQHPQTWDMEDELVARYFENDIARQVFHWITDEISKEKPQLHSSDFGKKLSQHFVPLKEPTDDNKPYSEALVRRWSLHDTVRAFYRDLATSVRFRRAVDEKDGEHLARIVPQSAAHLVKILKAKQQNRETSEVIRLGKLIVHAADLPHDTSDLNAGFLKRMDYFATSEGQSEIKRNESFTRVWRNVVGLSGRTIRALADSDDKIRNRQNDEDSDLLGSPSVSQQAAIKLGKSQENIENYRQQINLIFGDKLYSRPGSEQPEPASRASIFSFAEQNIIDRQEMLWTLMRLAGEIRHRTNHFNTKPRVEALITSGILSPTNDDGSPPAAFASRSGYVAKSVTLTKLDGLLKFDIGLQKQILVDTLNSIKFSHFLSMVVTPEKRDSTKEALFAELVKVDTPPLIVPEARQQKQSDEVPPPILSPKFMTLLRHAQNIAIHHKIQAEDVSAYENAYVFERLSLENLGSETKAFGTIEDPNDGQAEANLCRIGLLRLLYNSGFTDWLSNLNGESLTAAISYAKAAGASRAIEYQAEHKQFYTFAEEVSDSIPKTSFQSLGTLLNELLKASAAADNAHRTYRAETDKQKRQTDRFGKFKLDIFAHLFGTYLAETKLDWVCSTEPVEPGDAHTILITASDIPDMGLSADKITGWNSQFYAWLYLIPIDHVSLLRHQFRKTAALAYKSGQKNDPVSIGNFNSIDRLMALQIAVQAAGFSGDEHVSDAALKVSLYEYEDDFDIVYSNKKDEQKISFPGTRSGLRQLQRFGHFNVLQGLFNKHKITNSEYRSFTALDPALIEKCHLERRKKHSELEAFSKIFNPDETAINTAKKARNDYLKLVTTLTEHRFLANGARLTEHANIHHLMMRVVGRLMDFTLLWERDRAYYFLGALYRKHGANLILNTVRSDPTERHLLRQVGLSVPNEQEVFLPLWDDRKSFILLDPVMMADLLSDDSKKLFTQWFIKSGKQEQRDADRAEKHPPPPEHSWGNNKPKSKIRNDFAHYNVINVKKTGLNLTYLTNAVRSLFGYDRKLKNAISDAISDILAEEGIDISWALENDRLKSPIVLPTVETHLTMIKGPLGAELQFSVPQSSARYTSMVKGLFSFDTGGNRDLEPVLDNAGKQKKNKDGLPAPDRATGKLKYPEVFGERYAGKVPEAFFDIELPAFKKP